ncbi:hypothetical protein PSPO01_14802 [Paraphaeosphaeria sporulosa]
MARHNKSNLPGRPMYQPKDGSLGLLGTLPVELRLNIFEIVLEIHRPITARKCCGILGHLTKPCRLHAAIKQNYRTLNRYRFALLSISRGVYNDAIRVMHNKMRVHVDVINLIMVHKGAIGYGGKPYHTMWRRICRYRLIDLIVPVTAIKFDQSEECVTSLFDCIDMLLDKWNAENSPKSAQKVREITIHLGRIFSTYRPFKAAKLENPKIKEEQARLLNVCWENLENSVKLIALRGGEANWTFTVNSEVDASNDASNEVGQRMLNMFREFLEEVGVECQEEVAQDVSVMESRSATGGTHRRFVD